MGEMKGNDMRKRFMVMIVFIMLALVVVKANNPPPSVSSISPNSLPPIPLFPHISPFPPTYDLVSPMKNILKRIICPIL